MKAMTLACFAGLFLCASPAPLSAQEHIVVQPAPTLGSWSTAMTRRLESNLRYPERIWSSARQEGIARIAFRCSDDGRPSQVAVLRSSGSPEFDREALRAVRMIKTMHPLPDGMAHDQRYAAVVVFAASEGSRDRMLRGVAAERRLARAGGRAAPVLTLVGPIAEDAR